MHLGLRENSESEMWSQELARITEKQRQISKYGDSVAERIRLKVDQNNQAEGRDTKKILSTMVSFTGAPDSLCQ